MNAYLRNSMQVAVGRIARSPDYRSFALIQSQYRLDHSNARRFTPVDRNIVVCAGIISGQGSWESEDTRR